MPTSQTNNSPDETASGKRRPVIFLAVGIFNTLIDFAFYTLLTSVLLSNHSIALSGFISGTFALCCAFLTHGLITWRGSHLSLATALRFLAFTGAGMWILRPILLSLFIKLDPFYAWAADILRAIGLPFSDSFVANTGAFGFMIVILLAYNYLTYNRFVFKKA